MKQIVLAACLALSFALPSAHAQSAPVSADSTAAVKELLEAMHYRNTMQQTMAQMQKNMPAIMLQVATAQIKNNKKLTDAQKDEEIAKAAKEIPKSTAAMDAVLNDPALLDAMIVELVPLYARHFTAAELRQLAVFYRTPVGAKMIAVTPQIAGESMQISQKVIMPRLNAMVEKLVKQK